MDDKNVVKKRVTLAIAFAVFIVVVIAVILLIKPVMSKVQENRTAKVSQETAQEAEEFLKTKYPEVVIEKREMYVKEHKPQENTQYISSKSIDTEYSYASYVFYGTMTGCPAARHSPARSALQSRCSWPDTPAAPCRPAPAGR